MPTKAAAPPCPPSLLRGGAGSSALPSSGGRSSATASHRRHRGKSPRGAVSFGSISPSASSPSEGEANDRGDDDYDDDGAPPSEEGGGGDDDPLLSLFRAHSTNRVKFDLSSPADGDVRVDEVVGGGGGAPPPSSPPAARGGAAQRLKRELFARAASFRGRRGSGSGGGSNSSSSAGDDNLTASRLLSRDGPASALLGLDDGRGPSDGDDTEDDIVRRMLEPAPLRRMGSFFGGIRSGGGGLVGSGAPLERSPSSIGSAGAEKFGAGGGAGGGIDGSPSGGSPDVGGGVRRRSPKQTRESVARLLRKASRARERSFRYRLAMRYCLLALRELSSAGYPDSDPLVARVLGCLNDAHHAQSTVESSANIVSMGIRHEDGGHLVRALRMYTIAYRMRRDALGVDHPSLAVLLNMMGSLQVKRGEYGEAMKIYELSLKGRADENGGRGRDKEAFRSRNPLTTR